MEKALSPQVRCLVLSGRVQEVGIGGAGAGGRSVVVEQVGEVGGGLAMEGFMREEKDFEVDPL